jgi:2-C-methyl-D-erythritol 4-phosphate cytidylyltransferase
VSPSLPAVIGVVGDDPRTCPALLELAGQPLITWVLRALAASGLVTDVVVAVTERQAGAMAATLPARGVLAGIAGRVHLTTVAGSVSARLRSALVALPPGDVLLHDARYPLASGELVRAVIRGLSTAPDGVAGVVPVRAVTDTLKWVDGSQTVLETVRREEFRAVLCPQAYRLPALSRALGEVPAGSLADGDPLPLWLPHAVRAGGGRLGTVEAPGEVFAVADADDALIAEVLHAQAAPLA